MSEEYRQELVFKRHNFKMIDKADCRAELFTYVTQMRHSWSGAVWHQTAVNMFCNRDFTLRHIFFVRISFFEGQR